jgi:hypothetical protein
MLASARMATPTTFTPLEAAVLDATCQDYDEYGVLLRALLASARIASRENTGHGFYTEIEVRRDLPPVHPDCAQMECPIGHMLDMGEGMLMGFLLWLDHGYPTTLEGFQYGDKTGATVDLKRYDLASLRASSLESLPTIPPIGLRD